MSRHVTRRDGFLLLATLVWATVGYLRYLPAMNAESSQAYLRDAWRNLRYSDIAFLFFRDHLDGQPIPYVQYVLEYPVLLGLTSYVLSFTDTLTWYFTSTYLVLTVAAVISVYVLDRLPTADPAYLALAPGLMFYIGLNWDLAAIALCVVGLHLYRRNPALGTMLVTSAVWFKFFPIVFLAALVIDGLRTRAYRTVAVVAAVAIATTSAVNAPLAIPYFDRWSRFFRLNTERGADSNVWVLARGTDTSTINMMMTVAMVVGGSALIAVAWRSPESVVLPLGALLLLWWMVVNKTFQPQYVTWVFLACAMLRPAWALWVALAAVDLAGYATSFLIQYQVHQDETFGAMRSPDVEAWTYDNLYVPIQLLRSIILLSLIAWGVRGLLRLPACRSAQDAGMRS